MLRIAVTGGIACGKSLAGSFIEEAGIPVCDSDNLAHQAISSGTLAYRAVVDAFGRGILGEDGEVVRSRLGRVVFGDSAKLKKLNAMLHPVVRAMWKKWMRGQRGRKAVAVVVPLLYEIADERNWDAVICVGGPEADQRARLKARGLTAREVGQRLAAQMPVAQKMARADHVIYNCGSVPLLRAQTVRVINELVERKHA